MFASMMLISHTITDFIIQTGSVVELKSMLKLRGFILHGTALLASSVIMLIPVKPEQMLIAALYMLLIVCIHLVVDYLKELFQGIAARGRNLSNRGKFLMRLFLFSFDQAVHIAVILLIAGSLKIELAVNLKIPGFGPAEMMYFFLVTYFAFSGIYFIPMVMDVIFSRGGGYRQVLGKRMEDPSRLDRVLKTGSWIGLAERGLVLLSLVLGYWYAIFGILLIKTVVRRKLAFNGAFTGYFVTGTLCNLMYSLFGFFIIPLLLG